MTWYVSQSYSTGYSIEPNRVVYFVELAITATAVCPVIALIAFTPSQRAEVTMVASNYASLQEVEAML